MKYTTIRTIVKTGRAAKPRWSREKLVSRLLRVATGRHGAVGRIVMQRVARDLSGLRRQHVLWGNVRKDYDRLFKMVKERAPVPASWALADVQNFVLHDVRARILEQTSARFQNLRCSPKPLPPQ